jgi:hypothetical protein
LRNSFILDHSSKQCIHCLEVLVSYFVWMLVSGFGCWSDFLGVGQSVVWVLKSETVDAVQWNPVGHGATTDGDDANEGESPATTAIEERADAKEDRRHKLAQEERGLVLEEREAQLKYRAELLLNRNRLREAGVPDDEINLMFPLILQ